MAPRQLAQGSRRNQRRREVFKVRPNPAADEPVAAAAPSQAVASDPSFMLIDSISQLSDNYDLVESVASSLFDQIALPRR
jgi:hypothetical protein